MSDDVKQRRIACLLQMHIVEYRQRLCLVVVLLLQARWMRVFQQVHAAHGGHKHLQLIVVLENADRQHRRIGEFVAHIAVDQIVVETDFR